MQKGEQYAGGLALNFFDSTTFEDEKAGDASEPLVKQTRNLLRVLMAGWNNKWRTLLTWQTFKAVFVNRDHEMTKAMRLAFHQGFHHVFSQLDGHVLTPQQFNQAQLFISNCLTYLPYADITPYESLAIPQYVDGRWQMIDYKVTPIELTPTTGFKSLFLSDDDRVFAYGLEPINHSTAEPHLIFMGTTYPAGQGFTTTINTDLEAFETAGKKLYRSGHHNITRWLDQQIPRKTHVCGTSLGGALSLLVAIDQGNKLSRVDALNPPGLYNAFRKSRFDHWDELTEKPEVYIQKQGNDPVSRFGVWKADWHVLHVTPPKEKQGPNSFTDHALNYAGLAETKFIGVDTKADNKERRLRNFLLYTLLRSAVYYCIMAPFRYLILPRIRIVLKNKLQYAFLLPLDAVFYMYPPLPIVSLLPLFINSIIPAAFVSYLIVNLIFFAVDCVTRKSNSNLSKFLEQLADKPLLRAIIGVAVIAIAITLITSQIYFPVFTPFLIMAVAAIPFTSIMFKKVGAGIRSLFGYHDVKKPDCQNPALPRNDLLDIHKQRIEATFTYKEIGDYYQAKRCLMKGKPLIDVHATRLFKSTGLTKQKVLQNSQNADFHETQITFSDSKAKIYDMQHTIRLISKLGFLQADKLKAELQLSRRDYEAGKPTTTSITV